MKLSISISTNQEREYLSDDDRKSLGTKEQYRWLNPADKNRQPESISFNMNDFNFEGSLKPLVIIITDFLQEYMISESSRVAINKAKEQSKELLKSIKIEELPKSRK